MRALGHLLLAVVKMLDLVIDVYTFVILIAVLLSWVRPDPYNAFVRIIRQLTEPVFYQVRRIMPNALARSGIDLSPVLVLLLLIFLRTFVIGILSDGAAMLLTR
ncbi:MAG: YggT family protein [Deltaproteobacteria bacterium]|nr:YggT family protein [Deltaproteobacteria bacterium]